MSRAPYQAVILAAGRGSRIGRRTERLPKALLPIGPRSLTDATETCFLRRQCEILRDLGVDQIVVVVGYHSDAVVAAARSWGLGLQLVRNTAPDISASGSLHSFQFAARAGHGVLDGTRQTLMLDADIVYDRRAIALLLDSPADSSLLICRDHRDEKEEVRVYGSERQPRFIGKGLTLEVLGDVPCLGEATGVVKYAPGDHPRAIATMNWLLGDPDAPAGSLQRRGFGPARQATEHEELAQWFMHLGQISCVRFGNELTFIEVDDEAEYQLLRREVYPALLQAESGAVGR